MRKAIITALIAVFGVIAFAIPAFGSITPTHQAHIKPHVAQTLCSAKGLNTISGCLRLKDDSTVGGTPIFTSLQDTQANSQRWNAFSVSVTGCGSHVIGNGGGACPFRFGTGMNAQFAGDQIGELQNVNGNCLGFFDNGAAEVAVGKTNCGHDTSFTTVLVFDGFAIVDVNLSNTFAVPQYLDRRGLNLQAQAVNPFDGEDSQWGFAG